MFKRTKKKVAVPTIETTQITVPTLAGLKKAAVPAVTGAASSARKWSDEHAHAAGDWAKPRIEQGKAMAAPALTAAAGTAAAKGHDVKERFDETMPKVSESLASAVAAGSAARHEAARRGADAALVLRGEATVKPVKKRRGKGGFLGGLLGGLAILAAAAAAAVWFAKKDSAAKDDPWARPLTDPYVAPTSGRDATVDVDAAGGAVLSEASVAEMETTPPASLAEATEAGDVEARDTGENLGDTIAEGEQDPRHT